MYQAVKWGENPVLGNGPIWLTLFLLASIILFLFFSYGVVQGAIAYQTLNRILGAGVICFLLGLLAGEWGLYIETKVKKPSQKLDIASLLAKPNDYNPAEFLDYQAMQVLAKTRQKQPSPSLAILISLLTSGLETIDFVIFRAGLNLKQWLEFLKKASVQQTGQSSSEPTLTDIILAAGAIAQRRKRQTIGAGDLLAAVSSLNKTWEAFLVENQIKPSDLEHLVNWIERIQNQRAEQRQYWTLEALKRRGSWARDWSSSYTITLDRYSIDWVIRASRAGFRKIVGHQQELKEIERILSKSECNNVLLVGEPGAGRKTMVEALAEKAFLAESGPTINYKRVLQFDISRLTASLTSFEQAEAALDQCFAEAVRAGNIILVIDELHNFISSENKAGVINIAAILMRYLPLQGFKLVAVTSYLGLHQVIEKNPGLLSQFEKVEVQEISAEETLIILENFYVPFFENKLKGIIEYKALQAIAQLSNKYIASLPLPDKAIRLLDETVSYVIGHTKNKSLQEKHVRKVLSDKIQVPLEELEEKEKTKLLNMENLLKNRVIGQEQALEEVSSALRRARAEVQTRKGPIGSFLFLGPTGVGKTETAKALASLYFGSEQKMIRLDMSEFQNPQDIARLLGEGNSEGALTMPVRENPFSLVLLDELEKAHPNVLNLFLQVLDEGFVTDSFGRKVDFSNTIIIATSNAAAEMIRQAVGQSQDWSALKEKLMDYILQKQIFRPEFINRFDGVVAFRPLSQANLLDISQLLLKKISDNLKDKGITFETTKELKERIVQLSYNPSFGAREMRRVIQNKIENSLASGLLGGMIRRGDTIQISPDNFEIIKIKMGSFLNSSAN